MSIVRDFEKAFNRQDVDGLLACFTETGSYVDTFFGLHQGRTALREMFQRMFREGRDYAWVMDVVVESPTAAAAEWTFRYVVTDPRYDMRDTLRAEFRAAIAAARFK